MNGRRFLIGFAAVCLGMTGCAAANQSRDAAAPRSVQYRMNLDWSYALNPNPPKAFGSTPLELGGIKSVRGTTYVASGLGKVIAIDEKTAEKRWVQEFEAPVTAGPVVTPNAVYVALSDGTVLRLSIRNGERVWKYETGASVENSLAVGNGVVACVNSNNRIFVLDEETGTLKWRRERPRSQEFAMYGQSTPWLDEDGTVYAGFSDGFLVAFASNGTAIWSRELAPEARFKDLDTMPVRVGQVIYVASSSGGLYALSSVDGHTLWQRDIFGISGIVAFQDSLYLSSQSGVYRLRREDGETIWQNIVQKGALISSVQVGKDYLYASVQRYGLVILDRRSGVLRNVLDMGSDFTAAPHLTEGTLTALSNQSTVYQFIVDDVPVVK